MAKNQFVEFIEHADNWNSLIRAMNFIRNTEVYVGIPDEQNKREEESAEEITNAELLYIHTNGSPVNNIPARPVIEPAIRKDSDRLENMMKKAAELAFDNKEEEAINQLKKTGMRAQNVSRAWFVNQENGWPPNSDSTIAKKSKGKPKGYVPRPLIDTGQLRKAITYFVKTKGGRTK